MAEMAPLQCYLLEPLTPIEESVLRLMAQGLSDKEIGLKLNIAPITVRGDHKQNLYNKLGLQPGFRNRKWALHCARRLGLLNLAALSTRGVGLDDAPSSAFDTTLLTTFSPRERDFLRLLAEDRSNAEIAERLVLSTGTVRWYVKQLYAKLGIHSREEAVERANAVLQAPIPPPHNLPTLPMPFVGRERELTELAGLLQNPGVRLVTILSPGGMGKTRLAIELARRKLYTFTDGVFFVPLQAHSAPEHLLTAIAEALDFRFQENERPRVRQIGQFLRTKTLMLVLDNMEHLLDAAPLISELLAGAPSLSCLVTSRERLSIHGEVVYMLAGLDYSPEGAPDISSSAAQLFLHSVQYTRPGFSPDADDAAEIADICRLVDGIPLALELAASWLDLLSPAEIAREIRHDLDFLARDRRDVPARQHSMRAVFNAAWNRLSDSERDAFMRFAVFRDGCNRDAAQAISGSSLRTLVGLADKALLRMDKNGRYQIHELLRQFAEEKLLASTLMDANRDAHSAYYLGLLERLEPDIKGERFFEAQAEISVEMENLHAACLWAAERAEFELLASGISTLGIFFYTRDRHAAGSLMFLHNIAQAMRLMPRTARRDTVLAETLGWYAHIAVKARQFQLARVLLTEADALLQHGDDAQARIALDFAWARFQMDVWAYAQARTPYLDRALALLSRYPDSYLEAEVLSYLGWSHLFEAGGWFPGGDTTHLDLGWQYQEQAVDAARRAGNPHSIAFAMMCRADCVASRDYREGKRAFRECIAYCMRTGQRARLAIVVGELGGLYASRYIPGERDRALACYRVAQAIAEELGHTHEKIHLLGNMAVFFLEQGEFAAARECRLAQLALTEEDGDPRLGMLLALAEVDFFDGQYTSAHEHLAQARGLTHRGIDVYSETAAEIERLSAEMALQSGQLDIAAAHLPIGAARVTAPTRAQLHVEENRLMGVLAYAHGETARARDMLRRGCDLSVFEKLPDERLLYLPIARTRALLSQIEWEQGNVAQSRALVREILEAGIRFLSDSILLMGLIQLAHHIAPRHGVELASLVLANKRSYGFSREQAAKLLEARKGDVAADVFASAVERGKALDVNQTAQEWVAWLARVEE